MHRFLAEKKVFCCYFKQNKLSTAWLLVALWLLVPLPVIMRVLIRSVRCCLGMFSHSLPLSLSQCCFQYFICKDFKNECLYLSLMMAFCIDLVNILVIQPSSYYGFWVISLIWVSSKAITAPQESQIQ